MSKRRGDIMFPPKVTRLPDGRIRVRRTISFVSEEFSFDPNDLPNHPYDRHQFLVRHLHHADYLRRASPLMEHGRLRHGANVPPMDPDYGAFAERLADDIAPKVAKLIGGTQ